MRNKKKHTWIYLLVLAVVISAYTYIRFFNGSIFYVSTGFNEHTLFKVKDETATIAETKVLLSDAKIQYENFFGEEVWNQDMDGISLEDYVKDEIRVKLIRVKCMNILAKQRGVVLDRTESANVEKAAQEYMSGLTSDEKTSLDITQDTVQQMFREFAIAKRLYQDMVSNVDTEVSFDRARVIIIEYIYAKTQEEINLAKERVDRGENFGSVAREYNGEDSYEAELKRKETQDSFEEAAFNLKNGEVSDIISTEKGYYLIKCISDNEKAKTQANKEAIANSLKLDAFNEIFEDYESSLYVEFNQKLWDKIKVADQAQASVSFQVIFNRYFN